MNVAGNLGNFNNGITGPIVRDFLANGTWSKPAGLTCATFIAVGAGGGGGGGAAPINFQASGGAGGGGGGIYCVTLSAASLTSSPYCVCLGNPGAGGAAAVSGGTNGSPGCNAAPTYVYQCSGFVQLGVGGGFGGGGGCYCANTTSCIVVAGGAGGFGDTAVGNGGGSAVFKYNDIVTSNSACSGNGGRGGGSGSGYGPQSGAPGAGGTSCCYIGLRFGKGGDQCGGTPTLPGCVYGAGGGGGRASIISGAAAPSAGGAGANAIVRIIEYYS